MTEKEEETEFKQEYITEETLREEEEVIEEQEIDWDDGWTLAKDGKKSDLDVLRTPLKTTEIKIPIDFKRKKFMIFYIRELTTEEQLKMMEEFYQFHQKTGKATMNFLNFYRSIFRSMVKETKPRITWRDGRLYNKRFLSILMNYLPSPFELESTIDENESKNLKQLSEGNLTITKKRH